MKSLSMIITLFCLILLAGPASAGLEGLTIHGQYLVNGTINAFDPAIGFVPFGANPIQPDAVVDGIDATFPEFWFESYDPVSASARGCKVDVDDSVITVEWYGPTIEWSPVAIVLTGLSGNGPVGGLTVTQQDVEATITHDADSVTIDVVGGFPTGYPDSKWIVIELGGAVPTDEASWGDLKANYR